MSGFPPPFLLLPELSLMFKIDMKKQKIADTDIACIACIFSDFTTTYFSYLSLHSACVALPIAVSASSCAFLHCIITSETSTGSKMFIS